MWNPRHRMAPQQSPQDKQCLEVRCRDENGRAQSLRISCENDDIVLITPAGERLLLAPLQAGRLRAALRDLVVKLPIKH